MSYAHRYEIIDKAIDVVKSFGYKCFYPLYESFKGEKPSYCFITDGKRISYMQSDHWGSCIEFSTIRKSGKQCLIYKDRESHSFAIADITNELIERTFYQPLFGVTNNMNNHIYNDKCYRDWEDFVKNSLTGKICKGVFVEL
jgi:hypothetical protein